MIKANKPFYVKPCGPPRPILGLLRLKSVPFLAVKQPLEQSDRLIRDCIGENLVRVLSHSDDYFTEDVPEVDGSASDVIASGNLSVRRDGIYLPAFYLAAHD